LYIAAISLKTHRNGRIRGSEIARRKIREDSSTSLLAFFPEKAASKLTHPGPRCTVHKSHIATNDTPKLDCSISSTSQGTQLILAMANHPDFLNYGSGFEGSASEYSSHREWQESTYMGRLTLLVIKLGDNSFTNQIINSLRDQEGGDSPEARILTIFANLGGVIVGICVAYALGRILQIFIGQEIVMNQEIIIEEEITLSDYKKAMAEEAAKEKKKRRQKKAKNS